MGKDKKCDWFDDVSFWNTWRWRGTAANDGQRQTAETQRTADDTTTATTAVG